MQEEDKEASSFFEHLKRKVGIDRGRTLVLSTMRTICAERGFKVEVPDDFDFNAALEAFRLTLGWAESRQGHDFRTFMAVWGVPSEGGISAVLVEALAHQMMERFPNQTEAIVKQWALACGATFARQWQRRTRNGSVVDNTQVALA